MLFKTAVAGCVSISDDFISISSLFVRDCVIVPPKNGQGTQMYTRESHGALHPAVMIPTKTFWQRLLHTPNDDDDDSCHIYFDSPFDTVLLKVIETRPFSTTDFYPSTNLPSRHPRRQMIQLMILILPHLQTITYHCNRWSCNDECYIRGSNSSRQYQQTVTPTTDI